MHRSVQQKNVCERDRCFLYALAPAHHMRKQIDLRIHLREEHRMGSRIPCPLGILTPHETEDREWPIGRGKNAAHDIRR